MIVIRNVQWHAFESAQLDRFAHELLMFIRTECDLSGTVDGTTVPIDNCELFVLLRHCIDRAQSYGIDTEDGYAYFVILCLGFAREFYLMPLFNKILVQEHRLPLDRVKHALHEAVFYRAEVI